jgi:hypothetical protein
MKSVYCAVRIGSLNETVFASSLKVCLTSFILYPVLNIKIFTLQDVACEFAASVAYNSVSYEYMPVALISSCR